ncbi:hypothetical protein CF067_00810 [Clostridium sporogenes]
MKFNDSNNSLKELLKKEYSNYTYNNIEHRVVIQKLYSNEDKEEALNKLPQWIIDLRQRFSYQITYFYF